MATPSRRSPERTPIEPSTVLCCIEHWIRRELPDEILADALEEWGRPELAQRLRMLSRHKGKRLKSCTSTVTRDIIALMPRMCITRFRRGH